jgi:hypothetical protein
MSDFAYVAIHFAVAYLHALLSWRFYPERKDNFSVYVFWLMMVLSTLLHVCYAGAGLFNILQLPSLTKGSILAGYWLLAYMPSCATTLFLGELTEQPKKQTVLTQYLGLINADMKRLFTVCVLISTATVVVSGISFYFMDGFRYSFGNIYSMYFMFAFAGVWLAMLGAGYRPNPDKANIITPLFRFLMVGLLVMYLLSNLFNFGNFWSLIPIISTVGMSLCFCWYRFRIQFMDVIINQFIRFLLAIVATSGFMAIWQYSQEAEQDLQKLLVLVFIIAVLLTYQWVSAKLASIWHPPVAKLSMIHSQLPIILAQCHHQQDAINQTEQYLSELFNAQISINQNLDSPVQELTIEGAQTVHVQMGYLRRWMPWFSEALYWVRTAGLYLQSHLKILQSLEVEHQQKLKTEALVSLAAKAELNAMRSQIRPHFLFNILNSIHCFVRTEPERAEQTIEILSEIMRSVLAFSDKDTVALNKELNIVEKYLLIEKIRYSEQFDYQIHIDPACQSVMIPPFSVQPLVENAIKHAVDSQFDPVLIVVNVKIVNNQLLIEVLDDGPGLNKQSQSTGLGIAMKNIKSRLSILYGQSSELVLKNRATKGAMAVINIPLPVSDRL